MKISMFLLLSLISSLVHSNELTSEDIRHEHLRSEICNNVNLIKKATSMLAQRTDEAKTKFGKNVSRHMSGLCLVDNPPLSSGSIVLQTKNYCKNQCAIDLKSETFGQFIQMRGYDCLNICAAYDALLDQTEHTLNSEFMRNEKRKLSINEQCRAPGEGAVQNLPRALFPDDLTTSKIPYYNDNENSQTSGQ